MIEAMIPIVAILSTFGSSAFVIYLFFSTRNRERMALIERGQDASIFFSKSRGISFTLRVALLSMGVGLGILFAEMLTSAGLREEVAFPSLIFLMGGAGLLLAYWLDERGKQSNTARSTASAGTPGY